MRRMAAVWQRKDKIMTFHNLIEEDVESKFCFLIIDFSV